MYLYIFYSRTNACTSCKYILYILYILHNKIFVLQLERETTQNTVHISGKLNECINSFWHQCITCKYGSTSILKNDKRMSRQVFYTGFLCKSTKRVFKSSSQWCNMSNSFYKLSIRLGLNNFKTMKPLFWFSIKKVLFRVVSCAFGFKIEKVLCREGFIFLPCNN